MGQLGARDAMVVDRRLKAQSREASHRNSDGRKPLEESANGKQRCVELETFPMEPRFG